MDLTTIFISAAIGVIASVITAYITTHLKMREEKAKWRRDFAIKFVEAQGMDDQAHNLAVQFAIAILIKNPHGEDRERIFIAPNSRLLAGRDPSNNIPLDDISISRVHCSFEADDENVFVQTLGGSAGTFVNKKSIESICKLETGDMIYFGRTSFLFRKLSDR